MSAQPAQTFVAVYRLAREDDAPESVITPVIDQSRFPAELATLLNQHFPPPRLVMESVYHAPDAHGSHLAQDVAACFVNDTIVAIQTGRAPHDFITALDKTAAFIPSLAHARFTYAAPTMCDPHMPEQSRQNGARSTNESRGSSNAIRRAFIAFNKLRDDDKQIPMPGVTYKLAGESHIISGAAVSDVIERDRFSLGWHDGRLSVPAQRTGSWMPVPMIVITNLETGRMLDKAPRANAVAPAIIAAGTPALVRGEPPRALPVLEETLG